MKTSKITLLYVTILASLLLGTVAVNMVSAWSWMWAWWSPRCHAYDEEPPDPWKAYILGLYPRAKDIDPSTIVLEGIYSPKSEPKLMFWGFLLCVSFVGDEVFASLELVGGHLSPGKNRITLEITGLLYDGTTPFEASGRITLILPENSGP